MKNLISLIFLGIVAVILFDTLGSFASRSFDFNYGWLAIGSVLFDLGFGFCASRYFGLKFAPLVGGTMGFTDSTLGWYISWIVGPGRPDFEIGSAEILITIVIVTFTSAIFGFIGGLFGRFSVSSKTAD